MCHRYYRRSWNTSGSPDSFSATGAQGVSAYVRAVKVVGKVRASARNTESLDWPWAASRRVTPFPRGETERSPSGDLCPIRQVKNPCSSRSPAYVCLLTCCVTVRRTRSTSWLQLTIGGRGAVRNVKIGTSREVFLLGSRPTSQTHGRVSFPLLDTLWLAPFEVVSKYPAASGA